MTEVAGGLVVFLQATRMSPHLQYKYLIDTVSTVFRGKEDQRPHTFNDESAVVSRPATTHAVVPPRVHIREIAQERGTSCTHPQQI